MRNFLLILICLNSLVGISQTEIDTTIVIRKNDAYSMPDHLDSLLASWYYYTGRDTIDYLNISDRYSFIVDLPDSIYAERIRRISTPIELTYNKNVQKYLDRYVKNGKWIAPKFLGLSLQYFPMFEEKLDAYDIPLELKYLPIIESALNPKAKSPAGAVGLWQFMFKTGQGMGLEINSYVDERMDPEKSTDAACRYLKSLYQTYNNWTLTLAAYNAGPGTINNAIRRSGGKTNYWELYPYLPNETRNYVPGFIAIVYLFTYAEKHAYKPEYIEFIHDFDTVMIKKDLHFAQLDSILGIPVGVTRELNPQYKLDIVPAKNKEYPLKIQRKYLSNFMEFEDSIYAFMDTVFFNPKTNVVVENKYVENIVPATQPPGTVELQYIVKSGDSVGLIASWYGININQLKAWNGLANNNIRVGQVLKIYILAALESKYKIVNNLSFEEKQKMSGVNTDTNKTVIKETIDPAWEYYTVKSGDTPYGISQKFTGVTVDDIMKNNNISNASGLKIGQNLKIRKK